MGTDMVWCGSYPRSVFTSRRNPLPAAPAAVSISSVSATCSATITRCVRLPCALPITRRVLDCMTLPTSGRESCNAGEMPNTIAVATASAVLNSRTGRFISITDSAGKESDGQPGGHQRQAPPRDEHAERPARHGDRQRLGEQLPHNPAARRSQRRAHRQFVLPLRAARQ